MWTEIRLEVKKKKTNFLYATIKTGNKKAPQPLTRDEERIDAINEGYSIVTCLAAEHGFGRHQNMRAKVLFW